MSLKMRAALLGRISLVLCAGLTACNLPFVDRPGIGQTATAAVQLTQMVVAATINAASTQTAVAMQPPLETIQPGEPTPTLFPEKAGFVDDVTVPDGTVLTPGQSFTKTWRLKNAGSSTWTSDYSILYLTGEEMGLKSAPLGKIVPPGESVDVSVDLKAPAIPGAYRSYWKLLTPQGKLFGVGPLADEPFYVDIQVVLPTPTPTLAPFKVSTVWVVVSPPNYEGSCPATLTVAGSIMVTAPGSVQYQWLRDGTDIGPLESVTFSEAGQQTVSTVWVTSTGGSYQLIIISPNSIVSSQVAYSVVCK